jgi:aminoglycoside phosphotransferase (APT) family kinase protein
MPNSDADVRSVRPGEELDVSRLADFLREHLAGFQGELTVLQFPHGHSNLTYLIRSGSADWVLRRPPLGNQVKSAHDMIREYCVLSGLSRVFPPAPVPLAVCEDESVLGAPFYVMERRHGLILRHDWPSDLPRNPQLLREMCGALIDALADLHEVSPSDAGLADFGKPAGYVQRQVEGWTKRYLDAQTEQLADMDAVAAWLAANMPADSGASLIHNDFKFDNVAFDPELPNRVSTVFDWEMATVGDPLMDLGTTLGYWVESSETEQLSASFIGPTWLPGAMSRRELAERYARRRGLSSCDMHWYYVFGVFKIAVIVQQIYARFVRGFTRDGRFAMLDSCVRQLARRAMLAIEFDAIDEPSRSQQGRGAP